MAITASIEMRRTFHLTTNLQEKRSDAFDEIRSFVGGRTNHINLFEIHLFDQCQWKKFHRKPASMYLSSPNHSALSFIAFQIMLISLIEFSMAVASNNLLPNKLLQRCNT